MTHQQVGAVLEPPLQQVVFVQKNLTGTYFGNLMSTNSKLSTSNSWQIAKDRALKALARYSRLSSRLTSSDQVVHIAQLKREAVLVYEVGNSLEGAQIDVAELIVPEEYPGS